MVVRLRKDLMLAWEHLQMDLPFPIQRVAIVVVGQQHLLIRVPGFESTNNNFCACLLKSELDYLFNYKA